jgi:hypothetical protein
MTKEQHKDNFDMNMKITIRQEEEINERLEN